MMPGMAPADAAGRSRIFVEEAARLGFQRAGVIRAAEMAGHARYRAWLAEGFAGDMGYLARDAEPRRHPRFVSESAESVVLVALSYAHADPVEPPGEGPRGTIARYARGADYHMVMKQKLARLEVAARARLDAPFTARACVDTAPLLEREAAQAAGLGFIGKNTMLIAPGRGSYLVLGALIVSLACAPSQPEAPRCGQCRLCLDACPTGAFVDAHTLDARRCISYLTIELAGPIPRELRPLVGDRVFGCDVCQEVCPFNAAAGQGAPELLPRPGFARPALRKLLSLGAAQFRKWQRRGAMRRIHRAQLLRNVCVALGNVGDGADVPHLAAALGEPQPLVRRHAAWALGEIARRTGDAEARAALAAHANDEPDAEVGEEIATALYGR
jgi:epoxyqueuosine reductase